MANNNETPLPPVPLDILPRINEFCVSGHRCYHKRYWTDVIEESNLETMIEIIAEAQHPSAVKISALTSGLNDEIALYDNIFCRTGVMVKHVIAVKRGEKIDVLLKLDAPELSLVRRKQQQHQNARPPPPRMVLKRIRCGAGLCTAGCATLRDAGHSSERRRLAEHRARRRCSAGHRARRRRSAGHRGLGCEAHGEAAELAVACSCSEASWPSSISGASRASSSSEVSRASSSSGASRPKM
ncbi:hypothetical protein PR202_ga10681 [Eleusine coracana subsp. coracana]|uniref:Uncharacterized protein n=1 Tax=Eleusine coracana subsp. coracana TaxID=191504 RepID=A0AAV5C7E1_ELECO|nr:hypothetical protein PR202_ga10681 [Eleusine coracana subsp. coracana]